MEPRRGQRPSPYKHSSGSFILRIILTLTMALLMDKARRQIRAVAQWLNLALETPGETQARILYQVDATLLCRSVDDRANSASAFGDDIDSDSRRPENFPRT